MRKSFAMSLAAAVMVAGSTILFAEPIGSFGVNGKSGWGSYPMEKRVKHTDIFGDTYYTYTYVVPECSKKEVKKRSESFKKAPQEVMEGMKATMNALKDLQKNNLKDAEEQLQKATALFEQALKADPSLKLVPVDNEIEVFHFEGSAHEIKADIERARKLLKSFQTQAAREILMPMADEIVVTTSSLPMDLFPKATKDALKLLKEGKKDKALQALAHGFDTIVVQESIIPIPLLSAQELVDNASKVASKNPTKAQEYLKQAKAQLHRAVLLGYADEDLKAYKSLYSQITNIQKEIKAKHATKSLFGKIHKSMESLLNKKRNEKKVIKDSDNVFKGTAKAHAAAEDEEIEDKIRFLEKMEADDF